MVDLQKEPTRTPLFDTSHKNPTPPPQRRERGQGTLFQRADGMWIARVELPPDINGNRRRRQIARRNQHRAETELRKLLRNLAEHGDLPDKSPTLTQWATTWLEEIAAKRLKPEALASYRMSLVNHTLPALGTYHIDQLRPAHLRAFYATLTDQPPTAAKAHSVLKTCLRDAMREGLVRVNVAERVDPPRVPPSRRGTLTLDQTITVLQYLKTSAALQDQVGFTLALALGIRQGERLGLTWGALDLDIGTMEVDWELQRIGWRHGCLNTDGYIQCGQRQPIRCPERIEPTVPIDHEMRRISERYWLLRPKTAAGDRRIPLPDPIIKQLKQWATACGTQRTTDPSGLVFTTTNGEPVDRSGDRRRWTAALKAAGVPHVPQHSARHTAATLLAELEVDEQTRMAILGHAGVAITRHYTHISEARRLDALAKLGDALALGKG